MIPQSALPTPHSPQFDPFSLLLPYQQKWTEDPARFKIGVWSRQTGKSFSTAAECVRDCVLHPGSTWICLSAGERQALEWLEKAKEWTFAFDAVLETETETREAAQALLKSAEIRFGNHSRIIALPGNPATARGYSANVILDEFAYHENPDAIWASMFPSQTNPMSGTFRARIQAARTGQDFNSIRRELKLRVVSTFNGRNNKFYEIWERRSSTFGVHALACSSPNSPTIGNGFMGHFIDIHQAVAQGLEVNIDELRAGLDDPEAWAQEYECIPSDVSAVLLPYDVIARCESNEATTAIAPDWFDSGKRYVIGIDFARKHDLSVAWTDEILGDVSHCREVLEMRGMSTPDQVALLRPRIRNARRVCLDYTGPGVGMGDYLAKEFGEYDPQKNKFGKIELCTFTNALKVEIFSKLRMAFEQGKCRIPINRAVREDLHSLQRVTTSSGNVTYRAPYNEDGHADRSTAKALAQRASSVGGSSGPCYSVYRPNRPSGITYAPGCFHEPDHSKLKEMERVFRRHGFCPGLPTQVKPF